MIPSFISFNKESLLPKLAWKIIIYQQDRRQTEKILTAAESRSLRMAIKRWKLLSKKYSQPQSSFWGYNFISRDLTIETISEKKDFKV